MLKKIMPFIAFSFLLFFAVKIISQKNGEGSAMKKIVLSSGSFSDNSKIPVKYVCKQYGGQDISPALKWNKVTDAKSYALIVDDPDAPSPKNPRPNPWVHWVIYDLPAEINSLSEDANINSIGGKEGTNDFPTTKYGGPCPPKGSGPHRYFFKIYALDIETLNLPAGANKTEIMKAMESHILADGQLVGTFEMP
jgi:Raf kinase inhibitor-like YbhB/YbcL family protein